MNGIRQNSIRLFRFNGIDLSLHLSWFLVAAYEIGGRQKTYSSLTWNVLEYLALFLIVMLHEFGHALACRQVGGVANQIVLWPLGGVGRRVPWRGWPRHSRSADSIRMVWSSVRFYLDELLEGIATSASIAAS